MSECLIHIVGGVYRERCVSPHWDATYGSAGRAAAAMDGLSVPVVLRAYMNARVLEDVQALFAFSNSCSVEHTPWNGSVGFRYLHGLATPVIEGVPIEPLPALSVSAQCVLRFGMLESTSVVDADYAVYDPQNQNSTERFSENGSTAKHLALVLNLSEARRMSGKRSGTPQDIAEHLASSEHAEVVVIKMGPQGALVWHGGRASTVPAFKSKSVWKLGSGDVFTATFAAAWMSLRLEPVEAATFASNATAHYCEHRVFITLERLQGEGRSPIHPSLSVLSGYRPKVYLAAPFFDLSQVWMVEQARLNLSEVGLDVFSPFHDIGLGSAHDVVEKDLVALDAADVVYAWVDGADTGTIFEVGYAVAKGKKVVAFSQRETEESLKMLEGSNCLICSDYTTSVYQTLWAAVET